MTSTNENTPASPTKSHFYSTFFLCLFLGVFGVHRFYNRKLVTGVLQLVTLGGFGFWWFVDLLMVLLGKFKDKNGVLIQNIAPKMSWAVAAVVIVIGIAAESGNSETKASDGSSFISASSQSAQHARNSSKKSDQQIIRDWAMNRHGRNANVDIQSGFYGGAYQATVRVQIHGGTYDGGYDRYTYTILLNKSAQQVTLAELVEHN